MSFRKSISGFRKKVKDKLSKIGGRTGETRANAGDDGLYRPASSTQSEPAIVVEDEWKEDPRAGGGRSDPRPGGSLSVSRSAVEIGHAQGKSDDKADGGGAGEEALHPHSYVQGESRSSREKSVLEPDQANPLRLDTDNETTPAPSSFRARGSGSDPTVPDPVHVEGSPKDKTNWKNTASSATKLLLRTVERASDVFPPLKSVAAGLCAILDSCEQTVVNKQTVESLGHRVEALVESLCIPASEGDIREETRRKELERKLEGVRQALDRVATQKDIARFLNNADNAQKLNDLVEDIREAVMDYQTSLQRDIYHSTREIIDRVDLALLDRMRHIADAGYLSGNRRGCMKGTRREALFQLEQWSRDEEEKRVLWLNGLAGTGKSTIAQTFAEMCFADGKLGASFFCSRDFEDRSNLRSIFPTLAFQLAHRYPHFRQELLSVLRESPDVGRETLCSQMEKLIVGPFQATQIKTLIVVDALDECHDEEPASALLSILSRYMDKIPFVRFFITGRPEPRIRSGFRLESLHPHTDVLKLHEVEPSLVDSDIRLFLKAQFFEITKNRSDCSFGEEGWPSPRNLDILCKKAAGFFIYAAMVVKFIGSHYHPPDETLDLIISLPQDTSHEGKLGIDLLYTQVLSQAFPDVDSSKLHPRIKSVLGAVILISHPLSINTLSDLLRHCGSASKISSSLRTLHSVLCVPESPEDPVRIFHKSFPDFLTDPQRCANPQLFIDPSIHHKEILLSCLNVMKEKLRRNMCKLDDHTTLSKIEDLPTLRNTHIDDSLKYACQFWTNHLTKVSAGSDSAGVIQKAIDNFFATGFLFWVEALIMIGNLDIGVYALNDVEQWYMLTGMPCKWTADGKWFILDSFDLVKESPSEIYNTALTLCPSTSWLHKHYPMRTMRVKAVVGPTGWGTCIRTVLCSDYPYALACWKNTIATGVGVSSGDIIMYDTVTGSQTAILSGHTGCVVSLAFSSDGTLIVSGSYDKTIKLWDVQTGGVAKTLHGHIDWVHSVSISADNTMIASGSYDQTIRLWNIETGDCLAVGRYSDRVSTVSFSPTNPQILLSSGYNTVQQWGIDGHQNGSPIAGLRAVFSPDGTQFVSCMDKTVTSRNVDSKMAVLQFNVDEDALYCSFSPNGSFIAVVSGYTIDLWDVTGPEPHLSQTLIGHKSTINCLAFSSSLLLISASEDHTIKFWQINPPLLSPSTSSLESLPASIPIKAVSLQAKDGLAFSVDSEGVVKIWDILTGLHKKSIMTPARNADYGDMQAIGSGLVVSWCMGHDIYFWNAQQGTVQQTYMKSLIGGGLRISADGSRVFYADKHRIQSWSIEAQKLIKVEQVSYSLDRILHPLHMNNSKILVQLRELSTEIWDFGAPGTTSIQLSEISSDRPQLNLIDIRHWLYNSAVRVEDSVTGKVVFQLYGKHANPSAMQWDGRYLIAGYTSGEVLVLDFVQVLAE